MEIKFDRKPVYVNDEKYRKKACIDSAITNFHGKKIPKEKAPCMYLLIIMLDSVIEVKRKYCFQRLLKECRYEQKKIRMERLINGDLEKSESESDSNDETESDIDNGESDV